MYLVDIKVIKNIKLPFCVFEQQITTFYVQSTSVWTWLNPDSTIYEFGKTSKIDSTDTQSLDILPQFSKSDN